MGNLFFVKPCGKYSASTKVPDEFDPKYLADLVSRGDVIEVLPVDVTSLSTGSPTGKPVDETRWRYAAAELADLDLDMLNMFIAEHAQMYHRDAPPPFTDRESAIAFLGSEA
jgi:hypothetical protein